MPLLNPDQLVTSWRELLPNRRDAEFRRVPLSVAEPGAYLVEAVSDRLRAYTIVIVSDVGAVIKTAPNKENAVKLLEYLVSPRAQRYFVDVSLEYPVNPEVSPHPVLAKFGTFKMDSLNASVYAANSAEAAMIWPDWQ